MGRDDPLQDWKHGQKAVMQRNGAMPSWDVDVMTWRCVWDLEVEVSLGTWFQRQVLRTVLFKRFHYFILSALVLMVWEWVRPPQEKS